MRTYRAIALAAALLPIAQCDTQGPDTGTQQPAPANPTGNPAVTPGPMGFPHDDYNSDPFADNKQVSAAESARSHVCGKLRYEVMGNLLTSRGVSLAAVANQPFSASTLYRNGAAALGNPDYDLHVGETTSNTAGGLIKLLDVLIAAGGEINATFTNSTGCKGLALFNADGSCNADGFACLAGVPLNGSQLSLCTTMAKDPGFTSPAAARNLTVAAVLGTTMPCD